MPEQRFETTMPIRLLEAEDRVIIWIDGPFRSRSYSIPTVEATLFSEHNALDCRAIIFQCNRGGGCLWALYPCQDSEVQVRYDLRGSDFEGSKREISKTIEVEEPLPEGEIDHRWTLLWENTGVSDGH